MQHIKYWFILIVCSLLAVCIGRAQGNVTTEMPDTLTLPATYGHHMVLQRQTPLVMEGRVKPGTTVRIVLGKQQTTTQADDEGTFRATLKPMEAGGPYELRFESEAGNRTFTDVYVGEVWICSGQSNMELRVSECSTAEKDLKLAGLLSRVHFYNMESCWPLYAEVWNEERMDSVDQGLFIRRAEWTKCSAETARNFSAIGFHFAKMLSDSLKCHVGIISNAVGGSTTEGWIDETTLRAQAPQVLAGNWMENRHIMAWARNRAKLNLQAAKKKNHHHPFEPTYLFNASIRPIAGYAVRGVLWYQGESNADLVEMHKKLFPALETSWRKAWNNPLLPFYFVQLSSISTRPSWPEFRDSQRRLADSLDHTYMVVSSDVGDSLDVHPRRKNVVGRRLASAVLHHTYGFAHIEPCGPQPLSAEAEGYGTVRIRFSHAEKLRFAGPLKPEYFEMCSRNGIFFPAHEARIEGSDIVLRLPRVAIPTQVRYAWKPFTPACLINAGGMPCSTFRLDVKPAQKK